MTRNMRAALLAATIVASAAAGSADAAVITKSYVTTASFTGAPVSSVTLTYTLTFDPLAAFPTGTVTDYTTTSTSASFAGPVAAEFYSGGTAFIGRSASGVVGALERTDDFVASFGFDDSGDAVLGTTQVYFTTAAGDGTFFSTTAATEAAAVPEPAAWGLMLLGLGSVGAGLRRRRTRVAFA